jgi:hypothetical protein
VGALLAGLDVPEQSVAGQVVGGEQVPDAVGAVVGGAAVRARFPVGVLVLAADRGPVPAGVRHQVQRTELVQTENDRRIVVLGYHLAVGDAYRCSTRAFLTA